MAELSLRERLAIIETKQDQTHDEVADFRQEFKEYAKIQNGRVDKLEKFQDERNILERFGIGAFSIIGGGGILWILKMLGAF